MQDMSNESHRRFLCGYVLSAFVFMQILLAVVLQVLFPNNHFRAVDFITSISSGDPIFLILAVMGGLTIIFQQILRMNFASKDKISFSQIILVTILAEPCGLLGYVGGVLGNGNLSFAIPLIVLSLLALASNFSLIKKFS